MHSGSEAICPGCRNDFRLALPPAAIIANAIGPVNVPLAGGIALEPQQERSGALGTPREAVCSPAMEMAYNDRKVRDPGAKLSARQCCHWLVRKEMARLARSTARLIVMSMAGIAWLSPGAALAAPVQDGQASGSGRMCVRSIVNQDAADRVFAQLRLTSPQRERCVAIVRKGYMSAHQLRDEARRSWHVLMQTLRDPEASLEQALAEQRQVGLYQESLAEKRLATWFQLRKILTRAQLTRLSSLSIDPSAELGDANGEQGDSHAGPDGRH